MEIQERLNKLIKLTLVTWIFTIIFILFIISSVIVAQIFARTDATNTDQAFSNFENATTFFVVAVIIGIPVSVIPFVLAIITVVKYSKFPESLKEQNGSIFVFLLLAIFVLPFIFEGIAYFALKKLKVEKMPEFAQNANPESVSLESQNKEI